MLEWTDEARAYFAEALRRLEAEAGADEDRKEFAQDIRIHVETELSESGSRLITEELVRRHVVSVLGYDPTSEVGKAADREASPKRVVSDYAGMSKRGSIAFGSCGSFRTMAWIFGVILPLVTLAIEAFTGICASGLFDPIPSVWHMALVALVPVVCVWNLRFLSEERAFGSGNLLSLGIGAAIAVYYTIPFAVIIPFAFIGIIFYGLGLLPLAPVLALLILILLARRLVRLYPKVGAPWKRMAIGLVCGVGLILLVESPRLATKYGMSLAESSSRETSLKGIRLLRAVGSESVMMEACLPEFRNRSTESWTSPTTSPERAREIFYRVTGREYYLDANKEAERLRDPGVFDFRSRWDWYQGDQVVGRPVEGLSLRRSRMDAVVEADAAHAYVEWTMEFLNESNMQAEARALIDLPPGSVVSRVNLWINGEPREAAFGAKGKVIEAYKRVVTRRRDPLLVTTKGKDHVIAQCFPIPRVNGEMKIRLGIVVPIELENRSSGVFSLPRLSVQNFHFDSELALPVWIDARSPISSPGLGAETPMETIRSELSFGDLNASPVVVRAQRKSDVVEFWSRNPYAGGFVKGKLVERASPLAEKRWIVVLDSSEPASGHASGLRSALAEFEDRIETLVVVDEEERVARFDTVEDLRWSPTGGQDNAPAIEAALRLAEGRKDVAILWVHGSQSRLLSSMEGIHRQLNRRRIDAPFFTFAYEGGMNLLLNALEQDLETRAVSRHLGTCEDDLRAFLESLDPATKEWVVEYSRAESEDALAGEKVLEHATRLWALGEAKRLFYQRDAKAYERSAELAALHQLVTPASGAVVLENQQQYDEAGLNPVEKGTTSSIPDSGGTLVLLGVALVVLIGLRRRSEALR